MDEVAMDHEVLKAVNKIYGATSPAEMWELWKQAHALIDIMLRCGLIESEDQLCWYRRRVNDAALLMKFD